MNVALGPCESLFVMLMEKLHDLGAELVYSDPHIPVFPEKVRERSSNLSSVQLTPESLADFDCVLLETYHDKFDYVMLKECTKLIVDSRGKYLNPADHIIKAWHAKLLFSNNR